MKALRLRVNLLDLTFAHLPIKGEKKKEERNIKSGGLRL